MLTTSTPRFAFRLADGSVVAGVVQGAGGALTRRSAIEAAQRSAKAGRPLRAYEPKQGCVVVFPRYEAGCDGEGVVVDLRSAELLANHTHFSPVPNAAGRASQRVSVCGRETTVGDEARAGSSNIAHVTCPECLTRIVPYAPRQVTAA